MQFQNTSGLTRQQFAEARDRLIAQANRSPLLAQVRLGDLPDVATLKVDLDTQSLSAYGLSPTDVHATLATALQTHLTDMLALPLERPRFIETTALGAAMLAGIGAGLFADLSEAAAMRGDVEAFEPRLSADARGARLDGWRRAVALVVDQA